MPGYIPDTPGSSITFDKPGIPLPAWADEFGLWGLKMCKGTIKITGGSTPITTNIANIFGDPGEEELAPYIETADEVEFRAVLYNGKAYIETDVTNEGATVNVMGDIENDGGNSYYISGDFTIEYVEE